MPVLAKDGFQLPQQVHHIHMGLMKSSLMRQLSKLVEVVRHAYEVLGDGYRFSVVSADTSPFKADSRMYSANLRLAFLALSLNAS